MSVIRCVLPVVLSCALSAAAAQVREVPRPTGISGYLSDTVHFSSARPAGERWSPADLPRFTLLNREGLDRILGASSEALGVWWDPTSPFTVWWHVMVFIGDLQRPPGEDVAHGILFVSHGFGNESVGLPVTSADGTRWVYRSERYDRVYAGCRSRTLRLDRVSIADASNAGQGTRTSVVSQPGSTPVVFTPVPGSIADSVVRYLCTAPPRPARAPETSRARDIIALNLTWLQDPRLARGNALYEKEGAWGRSRRQLERMAKNLADAAGGDGWIQVGWWGNRPAEWDALTLVIAQPGSPMDTGTTRHVRVLGFRAGAVADFSLDTVGRFLDAKPPTYSTLEADLLLTCSHVRALRASRIRFSDEYSLSGTDAVVSAEVLRARRRQRSPSTFTYPSRWDAPRYSDSWRAPDGDEVPLAIVVGSPSEAIIEAVCDGARPR